jgi:hypothetical protein
MSLYPLLHDIDIVTDRQANVTYVLCVPWSLRSSTQTTRPNEPMSAPIQVRVSHLQRHERRG